MRSLSVPHTIKTQYNETFIVVETQKVQYENFATYFVGILITQNNKKNPVVCLAWSSICEMRLLTQIIINIVLLLLFVIVSGFYSITLPECNLEFL